MAMEAFRGHTLLRRGLIGGQRYPTAVRRVAEHIARRAFSTSLLARPFEETNDRLAIFAANKALIRIIIDHFFIQPYQETKRRRWTAPQMEGTISRLSTDVETKVAVARLAHNFLTNHQALLHGNLHTGCVMVTENDTHVISPKFATYGPLGFDLGVFVGNLLITYLSQPGYEQGTGERRAYGEWVLEQIGEFWYEFVTQFDTLWQEHRLADGYPSSFFNDEPGAESFALERKRWFSTVFVDMLGYAGTEVVRRVAGLAHKLDFEYIMNTNLRYMLEKRALALARQLILEPGGISNPAALAREARKYASLEAQD